MEVRHVWTVEMHNKWLPMVPATWGLQLGDINYVRS